jgi:hypothetical protein
MSEVRILSLRPALRTYYASKSLLGNNKGDRQMAKVRISKPAKTAMQSGRANTTRWLLEYAPADAQEADPLMGWAGSSDTTRQLKLWFDSKEEAVGYAVRKGLDYEVEEPNVRVIRPKSYADNFAFTRIR